MRRGRFTHRVLPVAPGVWCVRRASYATCSYVVADGDGVVLVDAGMDSAGGDVAEALNTLGFRPTDVRALLLTHWHNDHVAGAAWVQAAGTATVCHHPREVPFLTGSTARGGLRGAVAGALPEEGPLVLLKGLLGEAPPRPVRADRLVSDGEVLAGGFRVVETPGHTPGHVAYLHEPSGTLFAGDALAVVGGRLRLMARPVTPDVPAARESVRRLLDLPVRRICPGHRAPLVDDVDAQVAALRARLADPGYWPLLG